MSCSDGWRVFGVSLEYDYVEPLAEVEAPPEPGREGLLEQLGGMDFCHIRLFDRDECFCGLAVTGEPVTCLGYDGEAVCPSCGRPTCPVCAVQVDLAWRLEG